MDNTAQRIVTLTSEHTNCRQHPQVFAAKSIGLALPEAIGEVEVNADGTVKWSQFNYTKRTAQLRRGRLNRDGRRWLRQSMEGKKLADRKAVLNIRPIRLP